MISDLKPYPALKDSGVPWLGEVPENWEVLPLCAIARPKSVINQEDRALLSVYLSSGVILFSNVKEKRTNVTSEDLSKYQAVDPGDFVLNNQQAWRGSVGVSSHKGIVSPAYLVLSLDSRIQREFANLLFREKAMVAQYLICSKGVGSIQRNLYWPFLKRAVTILPPLPEQAAIVRFLDHADRRIRRYIRAKQKLIKLLQEQKQAIIHRAVTRGLDPNVRLKPSGVEWLGDVPEHWEVVTLRRLISRAVDGPHRSPGYLDEGIPFLSARNIKVERWQLDDVKYISEADYLEFSKRVVPEVGDVLYTKGGTTGVARVVDLSFRFQVWVHVAVLKVNKSKVTPDFLAISLNAPRSYEQSQLFTRGATNQDLGLGRMKDIVLALPPLTEQREILARLTGATGGLALAVDRARREIALIREYRTRLIADVVTGKVDVREAAARLPDEVEEPEPLEEAETDTDADETDEVDAVTEEAEA